ncbi:hypothetical protein [Aquipuribacter hungaricus]|uniref:Uncharacterized protein n=1 Tax=Aquipuribacter hungaricus TaxID=545624 RepID=A0ABV7WH67_9MICO
MRLTSAFAAAAVALLTLGMSATPATAATTTVTETALGSTWSTGATGGTGGLAFTTAFGAPAGLGTGALQLSTPDFGAKAQLVTSADLPLSALQDASFSTFRAASSTAPDVQTPAINVTIDHNGPTVDGGFAVLVFEPYYTYGTSPEGSWETWSAKGQAKWWSTRAIPGVPTSFSSFVALDDIIAANPAARISSFGVNQGSGNPDLLAAVDGLTVGGTTYDFEPRVFTKVDCKDGGWATNFPADTFVNQGDCVSYYASGGKTHG